MLSQTQSNAWAMEVEDTMIIEDLDPKHSLRCKVSCETAEELEL